MITPKQNEPFVPMRQVEPPRSNMIHFAWIHICNANASLPAPSRKPLANEGHKHPQLSHHISPSNRESQDVRWYERDFLRLFHRKQLRKNKAAEGRVEHQ